MKKIFLLMPVLASLLMAGCSQEGISPDDEIEGGDATRSYMVVNLVNSDAAGTRAVDGKYEDGTDAENKVASVRFYFFNSTGAVVNVKKKADGSYVNYYDWTPENTSAGSGDVEKKLETVIVIDTKAGDRIPQRMSAVLNKTADLGDESMSLMTLKEKVKDFATAELTAEGKFVMFSSTYVDDGIERCTVGLKEDNLQKSEDGARKHPVIIHVERNVAKVHVALGSDVEEVITEKGLALKDKDGKDLKIGAEEKQVYLKIDGWALTAESSEGRLVKHIDTKWAGNWWYDVSYPYRTFWAINSATATNKYDKSYDDISTELSYSQYTNENAENGTEKHLEKTKVILKGKLCDESGNPFTVSRHMGAYYAEDENLTNVKKSILTQLQGLGDPYYYDKTEGDVESKAQIDENDIKIVVADQTEKEIGGNCYVYAKLTEAAEGKTWYTSLSDEAKPLADAATTINKKLKDKVDKALVWKNGQTYYYYEIKHLQDGQNGVVRNHIYRTRVTKIAGLGTPVYDPTKVIYPEKPDANDHYIAAEVDVLSWHIVSNDNELIW